MAQLPKSYVINTNNERWIDNSPQNRCRERFYKMIVILAVLQKWNTELFCISPISLKFLCCHYLEFGLHHHCWWSRRKLLESCCQIRQFVLQCGNERYSHSRAENVNFSPRIMLAKSCITKITTIAGNRLKGTITNITPTWSYPFTMEFIYQTTQWGWSEFNPSTAPSLWLTPGTPEGKISPAAPSLSVHSQLTVWTGKDTNPKHLANSWQKKQIFARACSEQPAPSSSHIPCCVWAPAPSCSGAPLNNRGWLETTARPS